MKNNKKRDEGKRMTSKGSSAFSEGKQDETKKGATSNAKPVVLLPQNDRQQFWVVALANLASSTALAGFASIVLQ